MYKSDAGETFKLTRLAEASLLGSIFIEPELISKVRRTVKPDDFLRLGKDRRYNDTGDLGHPWIYEAALACHHPDYVSVAQKMQELGTLRSGDCAYFCHMVAECPTSLDWEYYAKVIRSNSQKRDAVTYNGRPITTQYRGVEI